MRLCTTFFPLRSPKLRFVFIIEPKLHHNLNILKTERFLEAFCYLLQTVSLSWIHSAEYVVLRFSYVSTK